MFSNIKNGLNLVSNMGWRYTKFQVSRQFLLRTGLLKKKFPVDPPYKQYVTLDQWKRGESSFFFASKKSLSFPKCLSEQAKRKFDEMTKGKFTFFNSVEFYLGKNYDWITNPDTNYRYDSHKHWTEIADYSLKAGDIKYVWEKSRFSFLYDIIRYDYHVDLDCAEMVFSEIISWIDANPVNCGPNYRCSQEISLRILNWTFALYYYRDSVFLTEDVFNKIQFAIYWQIDHVFNNINFSRIAVRNNHAITETLALYLTGLLYPQFPRAEEWKQKGRAWFEEEITYQVYEDGTFLQFSMNYHRVVVQLLTWAIVLAEKNNESFAPVVYERAKKSLGFLRTCMIDENGKLPNYGANDGALFFKLSDAEFRDYRPQLSALAIALKVDVRFQYVSEDAQWYGIENRNFELWQPANGFHQFNLGGYYVLREKDALTFIRCGNHKDRPSQADNLHLDVWYKGENVLMDAGSYKYNTHDKEIKYFMGTRSHNTIMLGNYDQMKKGPRFIWYKWTQRKDDEVKESFETYFFEGSIYAFSHVAKGIVHQREVIKVKEQPKWIIRDTIFNKPDGIPMKQLWHLPLQHSQVSWKSFVKNEQSIIRQYAEGFVSELYGKKENCEMVIFQTNENFIRTEFEITGK